MRRWAVRVLTGSWVLFAALAAMVVPAVMPGRDAIAAVYPDPLPLTDSVRASVATAPRPRHDPRLPTAVLVVSSRGANAADLLAPYEVLSVSGEFNVYIAGPVRRPVPLTGGLDVVPDYSFAELGRRLRERPDVVIVPEVPDVDEATADPVRDWVVGQASAGATVLGVCTGAEVLAGAGLLTGRQATSHWLALGLGGMGQDYPAVRWVRDVRYVEDGRVLTTAGVLSGVDGALRILERHAGQDVARRTAAAVGWQHYRPGRPGAVPGSRVAGPDTVALLNLGFRQAARMGVLLTDGVGELELALGRSAARAAAPGRAEAARAVGLEVEYLHRRAEFPFDAVLRDIAATTDVATATWVAKTLEYPVGTELAGTAWPWALTGRALVLGFLGATVAAGISWFLHRSVSSGRRVEDATARR